MFYAHKSAAETWELLFEESFGWPGTYHAFHIDPDYVEFGFEFNIVGGTQWPYSGVFWGAGKTANMKSKGGRVEDIQIKMAGSASLANIYIYVNSETIVSHEHCDTHLQFPWGSSNTIRVNIRKPGAYSVNDSNLYARKEGGTWEKVYNNDKTSPFYISREYVAFGFEFDIMAGTDWPYSDVFWTEKQTRSMLLVDTIDV